MPSQPVDSGAPKDSTDPFDPTLFAPPPPFTIPAQSTFHRRTIAGAARFDIDGEGPRQQSFEQTVGPKTARGASVTDVLVQLARDPHEPEHPDAVAVYIGQHHVGHIPHQTSSDWHAVIDELDTAGLPAVCRGEVPGGWHRPGRSTGNYGLVVYASDPPHILSDSDPTVVTTAGRISIEGEQHCQDYLAELIGEQASRTVVVRLDPRHPHRITAHHEDQLLGWLTSAMSERYAPFLEALESNGLAPTCRGTIRFGRVKYELSLKLPTGSDLVAAIDELGAI